MPTNNGKITAPVSVGDVGRCLGVTMGDVGGLCANGHGKTNRWAKYKPVKKQNILRPLTDSERKAENWGLEIPVGQLLLSMAGREWRYVPPAGGMSSPYRLADFNGYGHYAVPLVRYMSPLPVDSQYDGRFLKFSFIFNTDTSNGGLIPSDMAVANINSNMADAYAGIVLFRETGNGHTRAMVVTSNRTIGNGGTDFSMTFNDLETGVYKIVPVISPTMYSPAKKDSLTSITHNVIYIENDISTLVIAAPDQGFLLKGRVNISDEYYKTTGGAYIGDGTFDDYAYVTFLPSGSGLDLAVSNKLYGLDEARRMVSVGIIRSGNSWGFGLHNPITEADMPESLDDMRKWALAYGIMYWATRVDNDGVVVALKYTFKSGIYINERQWDVTMGREIMVLSDGTEQGGLGLPDIQVSCRPDNLSGHVMSLSSSSKAVARVVVGNLVSSDGQGFNATGVYMAAVMESGERYEKSLLKPNASIVDDANSPLSLNVYRETGGGDYGYVIRHLPQTKAYVDVTIDTNISVWEQHGWD